MYDEERGGKRINHGTHMPRSWCNDEAAHILRGGAIFIKKESLKAHLNDTTQEFLGISFIFIIHHTHTIDIWYIALQDLFIQNVHFSRYNEMRVNRYRVIIYMHLGSWLAPRCMSSCSV